MICKVLPHIVGAGAWQMAMDLTLLNSIESKDIAFLRAYEWREPTLSLGWFQKIAQVETDPRWLGVPLVRRPTGGGAIWHDREITYSLVVPRSPTPRGPTDLYQSVHQAIVDILISVGVEAAFRGGSRSASVAERPFLCFQDCDPLDLVVKDRKIVGSAQRRGRDAVLVHGSLLLGGSERTQELPGLDELAGVSAPAEVWSQRLTLGIATALGFESSATPIEPALSTVADGLAKTVFGQPSWTRRR